MDNLDYKIVATYKASDIKHDDYVLYDGEAYKIHLKKYQGCGKIYTHITCKCHDFIERFVVNCYKNSIACLYKKVHPYEIKI